MDARGYDYEGAYTPVPFWGGMATVDEYIKSIGGEKTTSDDGTTYTITATNQDDDLVEVLTMLVPDQKVQEAIKSITITEANGTYTVSVTNQDDVVSEVGTITVPTEYIKDVTVTNENGVYTVSKTDQDGTTTEAGTIEVPEVDTTNIIAEINDSVVENETDGYDFHTLTETEYNGTKNEVGSFYLARQQVTSPALTISTFTRRGDLKGVNQSGEEISIPTTIFTRSASDPADDTIKIGEEGTPSHGSFLIPSLASQNYGSLISSINNSYKSTTGVRYSGLFDGRTGSDTSGVMAITMWTAQFLNLVSRVTIDATSDFTSEDITGATISVTNSTTFGVDYTVTVPVVKKDDTYYGSGIFSLLQAASNTGSFGFLSFAITTDNSVSSFNIFNMNYTTNVSYYTIVVSAITGS